MGGTLSIDQGTFVAIMGPHGEGKSTLLKLLGGSMLPEHGNDAEVTVFVPAHLRILHVSRKPMFLEGSLLKNLKFGLTASSYEADASVDRICKICELLGLPERILEI